jgi:hypothetical protein
VKQHQRGASNKHTPQCIHNMRASLSSSPAEQVQHRQEAGCEASHTAGNLSDMMHAQPLCCGPDVEMDTASAPSLSMDVGTSIPTDCRVRVHLPPRIVVEMPDGGVKLGEDNSRLHKLGDAAPGGVRHKSQQQMPPGIQPGSTRWANMVACQYGLALRQAIYQRAKVFAFPIGALSAAFRRE